MASSTRVTDVSTATTFQAKSLDPLHTDNGVRFDTQKCFVAEGKLLALGAFVPDIVHELTAEKNDFLVVVEADDFDKLNGLLGRHFKTEIQQDMQPKSGIDCGPIQIANAVEGDAGYRGVRFVYTFSSPQS
jgi:hypothetical protein